jgi:hypothetical protein
VSDKGIHQGRLPNSRGARNERNLPRPSARLPPPQALITRIEPKRSKDETRRFLHPFPSPQHLGHEVGAYVTEFLEYFQKIFTMLLGLWTRPVAMLPL